MVCLLPVQRPYGCRRSWESYPQLRFDAMSERACENCARDDDDLVAVHRVYVVPESWDTPGSSQTVDEVELWCFSCRSQYPHQEA
jgi:hypothetical protein